MRILVFCAVALITVINSSKANEVEKIRLLCNSNFSDGQVTVRTRLQVAIDIFDGNIKSVIADGNPEGVVIVMGTVDFAKTQGSITDLAYTFMQETDFLRYTQVERFYLNRRTGELKYLSNASGGTREVNGKCQPSRSGRTLF